MSCVNVYVEFYVHENHFYEVSPFDCYQLVVVVVQR